MQAPMQAPPPMIELAPTGIVDLPACLLLDILERVGAWEEDDLMDWDWDGDDEAVEDVVRQQFTLLWVCKQLRDVLAGGGDARERRMEELLVMVAQDGDADDVRRLLQLPEPHAPRADCLNGEALVQAAARGAYGIVRMLLEVPQHAPRPDVQNGRALVVAAECTDGIDIGNHEVTMCVLLGCPGASDLVNSNIDHANYAVNAWKDGMLRELLMDHTLCSAAFHGHDDVVRRLLAWPQHAPHADAETSWHQDEQEQPAVQAAVQGGHEAVVRTLLGWPVHATPANYGHGELLVEAAEHGHE
ncbi:hypothetical protein FOA52_001338 [Chlamydomonas sp. UWO 241]|nr:hypothetical protein FOA52_001338 [Chlamydomonas sp. UWO 241]